MNHNGARGPAGYYEVEARSRVETAPAWSAVAAASARLMDEAMLPAERAVDHRDPFVLLARVSPLWAPLREHPGFGELIARLGLAGAA